MQVALCQASHSWEVSVIDFPPLQWVHFTLSIWCQQVVIKLLFLCLVIMESCSGGVRFLKETAQCFFWVGSTAAVPSAAASSFLTEVNRSWFSSSILDTTLFLTATVMSTQES